MNILFVHQSFPGQYRHIIRHLASFSSNTIVGLGIQPLSEPIPPAVIYRQYSLNRGTSESVHPWAAETETKVIRANACGDAAFALKQQGFHPDIICAHPGWGESLFLHDIWPSSPILSYQEFFYRSRNSDFDFDPEFPHNSSWHDQARLRMKNAYQLLSLESSTWNVTPTYFQRDTFPTVYHPKLSVIHDGIDTNITRPQAFQSPSLTINQNLCLNSSDTIVSFVNRHLEPYRGFHQFIRAVPAILDDNPTAHIVIVGSEDGVSYGKPHPSSSWKHHLLSEIASQYDTQRLHFVGTLSYHNYLSLLQISSCHVYLTYPFVLSWSLLEAMSSFTPVVASRTAPLLEVIEHENTGLLVDFFSPEQISKAVSSVLQDNDLSLNLKNNAREHVLSNYSLGVCLPRQISLIESVLRRSLPS